MIYNYQQTDCRSRASFAMTNLTSWRAKRSHLMIHNLTPTSQIHTSQHHLNAQAHSPVCNQTPQTPTRVSKRLWWAPQKSTRFREWFDWAVISIVSSL